MRRLGFAMAAVLLANNRRGPLPPTISLPDVTAASGVAAGVEAHHRPRCRSGGSAACTSSTSTATASSTSSSAPTADAPPALLNDGKGHFTYLAPSHAIPPTEIHLAYDTDEDGRADAQTTHDDGGGPGGSTPPRPPLALAPTFNGRPHEDHHRPGPREAMIDLDRDGKVDWLRDGPAASSSSSATARATSAMAPRSRGYKETSRLPVDIDGDGFIDLLVKEWGYHYGKTGQQRRILRNDGNGTSPTSPRNAACAVTACRSRAPATSIATASPTCSCLENKVVADLPQRRQGPLHEAGRRARAAWRRRPGPPTPRGASPSSSTSTTTASPTSSGTAATSSGSCAAPATGTSST